MTLSAIMGSHSKVKGKGSTKNRIIRRSMGFSPCSLRLFHSSNKKTPRPRGLRVNLCIGATRRSLNLASQRVSRPSRRNDSNVMVKAWTILIEKGSPQKETFAACASSYNSSVKRSTTGKNQDIGNIVQVLQELRLAVELGMKGLGRLLSDSEWEKRKKLFNPEATHIKRATKSHADFDYTIDCS